MFSEITDQIARVGVAVKNQISSTFLSFYSGGNTSEPQEVDESQESGTFDLNCSLSLLSFFQELVLERINEQICNCT